MSRPLQAAEPANSSGESRGVLVHHVHILSRISPILGEQSGMPLL